MIVDPVSHDSTSSSGFDYCFWSKLLVAIVLFPQVAFIAAFFFTSISFKILAAAAAIAALIYAAIYIDRIPCLTVKIPALLGKKAPKP